MKLASVEVIPYALPFREPYVTATGTLTRREMVLLRLTTAEGLVGLGEAVPLSMRGGTSIEAVVRELEEVGAGEALDDFFERGMLEVISAAEIDPRLTLSAPSRCALMTAVTDIWQKVEEPDPSRSEPVLCNATLSSGDPAAVAAAALSWADDGFSTFKLKLGAGGDVAQVRAVRDALGPAARIRIDANGSWTLEAAAALLAELEPLDIELVEQPVATVEEAAQLSQLTSIRISGDESIASKGDAERAVALEAFQATGIKLSKVGGLFAGMEIAEVMPFYVSSALDGPVGIAAGASLAVTEQPQFDSFPESHRLAHGLATQRLFASTIASVESELRDGILYPPPGPGLGVEIDEDALKAHRL